MPWHSSAPCLRRKGNSTTHSVRSRRACAERASSGTYAAWDRGQGLWAGSRSCDTTTRGPVELFEESLAIHRSLDDAWGITGSLSNLALLALEAKDNDAAERLLDESLELERKGGHHGRVANSLEISAKLAAAQDRRRPRRSPVRSSKRPSRIDRRRSLRGLARSRAARRPPPLRTRREGVRRGVGARRGDDTRRIARLRAARGRRRTLGGAPGKRFSAPRALTGGAGEAREKGGPVGEGSPCVQATGGWAHLSSDPLTLMMSLPRPVRHSRNGGPRQDLRLGPREAAKSQRNAWRSMLSRRAVGDTLAS